MTFSASRRGVLGFLAVASIGLAPVSAAWAAQDARTFIQSFGEQLVAIVNSPLSLADKKEKIMPLVSRNVDIDGIGRYCLGRFWKTATPEQQQHYLVLFHQILANAIADKLGDYRGVSFTIGNVTRVGDDDSVEATLMRPQQPPAAMQWVVNSSTGSPKVVDVIGEGASLRLTQRNDYSSFIARNGGDVEALLRALQKQIDHHNAASAQQ
ncbi:MlaC/ttg2D family ABC transporter substrate-binding protein [Acetobacter peroxydans]|uniref:Toluene transporter n=1 Tax=Acetobacter peroxydans TaxID=104098 RepID=A0A4Y3TVC1_9PROT|nr:ABC transporter substrate-binding protein [Acetobacter peroxydans]NHO16240.1 ABC transporter substrate-binding protein [Acetobacter peroxydans]GBR35125.1 toluene transporter auxiliary component Ttg2D [Acetobacter peroxydans NBRC 13755]GBR43004.1 toluene transporter auxiliary component Ttg2D [Acetobacter peroxydans]GEB85733.1 hypothetical protein APE01nite_15300 [Acetobacter peroxydans]